MKVKKPKERANFFIRTLPYTLTTTPHISFRASSLSLSLSLSLSFFLPFFVYKHILYKMVKVTVCGAAGGIGQPLSLILKQSSKISHLSLYDIVNTPGVAADLR